jgi:RHS repeat-associated protein
MPLVVAPAHIPAVKNAQFNVLGLVDDAGGLEERYEYTPYGQRTTFRATGVNDPLVTAPIFISERFELPGGADQPYALNPFGHQGLYHDEETSSGGGDGLIYNRARMLHPRLGRFTQRDPLGYVDGMSAYAYYAGMHDGFDPSGQYIFEYRPRKVRGPKNLPTKDEDGCCTVTIRLVCNVVSDKNAKRLGVKHCFFAIASQPRHRPVEEIESGAPIMLHYIIAGAYPEVENTNDVRRRLRRYPDKPWGNLKPLYNGPKDNKTFLATLEALTTDSRIISHPDDGACELWTYLQKEIARTQGIYDPLSNNSNTFLLRALENCGEPRSLPEGAVYSTASGHKLAREFIKENFPNLGDTEINQFISDFQNNSDLLIRPDPPVPEPDF